MSTNKQKHLPKKKRIIIFVLALIVYAMTVVSSTYAFLSIASPDDGSMTGTPGCFGAIYYETNITNANLSTSSSYLEGVHSQITLYKDVNNINYTEATIYLHTNEGSDIPLASEQSASRAFRYVIYDGSEEVASGIIQQSNSDISLATITLAYIEKQYDVYIWIDNSISGGSYEGKSYSGYLYADANCTSNIKE